MVQNGRDQKKDSRDNRPPTNRVKGVVSLEQLEAGIHGRESDVPVPRTNLPLPHFGAPHQGSIPHPRHHPQEHQRGHVHPTGGAHAGPRQPHYPPPRGPPSHVPPNMTPQPPPTFLPFLVRIFLSFIAADRLSFHQRKCVKQIKVPTTIRQIDRFEPLRIRSLSLMLSQCAVAETMATAVFPRQAHREQITDEQL